MEGFQLRTRSAVYPCNTFKQDTSLKFLHFDGSKGTFAQVPLQSVGPCCPIGLAMAASGQAVSNELESDVMNDPMSRIVGGTLFSFTSGVVLGAIKATWSDPPVTYVGKPLPALKTTAKTMGSLGGLYAGVFGTYCVGDVRTHTYTCPEANKSDMIRCSWFFNWVGESRRWQRRS